MQSPQKFSPNRIKKSLPYLIGSLFLCFALLAALGVVGGIESVWHDLQALQPQVWLVLLAGFTVNAFFRGARWPLGAHKLQLNVPSSRVWLFYLSGFSLAATPGKVGTAIRLWLLKEKNNIRYQHSAPLFILDQATDLIAILALTVWGMLSLTSLLTTSITVTIIQLTFLGSFFIIGTILLLHPKLLRRTIKALYALLGKRKKRLFAKVLMLFRRLNKLFSGSFLILMIGFALIAWFAEMFALSYLSTALGHPLSLQLACGILGLTILMSIFSFLPGGVGVAEAGLAGLLTLTGCPLSTAVVVTALIRFFTLWIAVLLGLCVLPFGLRIKKA